MQHTLHNHWSTWTCTLGCDECFESAKEARNHLIKTHADICRGETPDSLVGILESPKSQDARVSCPLCKEPDLSIKEYARHVGRHQKDLSLFSLPPLGGDDDKHDPGASQGTEQVSEDTNDESVENIGEDSDSEGTNKPEGGFLAEPQVACPFPFPLYLLSVC